MRDTDRGAEALTERLTSIGSPKISVGIFESEAAAVYEDGATVLDVATFHEFGLGGMPERSFLRAWFDENQERAKKMLSALLVSVAQGKRTKEQALETFGLWLQGEIQKRIAGGISPGLAPETVAKKGSSVPLIDTGQLRSSITFKVEP